MSSVKPGQSQYKEATAKWKDTPASNPACILHALANALNGISIIVQLQQRYLVQSPEQMRQLITATTKDLKDEVESLKDLIEHLHQVLKDSNPS